MKLTRKQLRNLIAEATDQERTPEQKLLTLMRTGMEGLRQAEMIADPLGIDLFSVFGSDYQAVNAILGPYVDDGDGLTNLIYAISDNSFYEKSFFSALFYVLPTYLQYSLGMSSDDIMSLIHNDEEEFYIYSEAETALSMTYQSTLATGGEGGIRYVLKDWIVAIWFLKLAEVRRAMGEDFSLVDEIENIFGE